MPVIGAGAGKGAIGRIAKYNGFAALFAEAQNIFRRIVDVYVGAYCV
jgi:hypothetical protein